jgi:magnesium chelatase subunit D
MVNGLKTEILRPNSLHKVFPFAAIVGQERMKLSLLLNAINPLIGGVLIRGEKGTAKSTAVRGLARLLPPCAIVDGCPFHCDPDGEIRCTGCTDKAGSNMSVSLKTIPAPMVDLPLGATEDMVLGAIDFEAAVKAGASRFMPGLLARANRGILYIDEVNLLDDHLVDAILDVSESGVNLVEREGMSMWHPSRFILIGTMNPEEGELRPQILDRFGLAVQVEAESDPELRVELLRRREHYDLDPATFTGSFNGESVCIRESIINARSLLPGVFMPNHLRTFIAEICTQNSVAGHRADLAMERAACAHAALNGRTEVSSDDIIAVAPLALLHRMRNVQEPEMPPPPPPPSDNDNNNEENQNDESTPENDLPEQQAEAQQPPPENGDRTEQQESREETGEAQPQQQNNESTSSQEEVHEIGAPFKVRRLTTEKDKVLRSGSGRRSRTRSATKQGRYVKSTPRRGKNDLALDATLRAAAPFQLQRKIEFPEKSIAVHIKEADIREKIRERRVGNVLLFLVDGSGSMGAHRRMVETKAAVMSLLLDAYQKRDKVCMIVFRGTDAKVVLPPTGSVDMAGKLLEELSVGGRTPLSAGLSKTAEVLGQILRKSPTTRPLVLVVTDGKANTGLGEAPPHQEAIAVAEHIKERFETTRFAVIDTEPPGVVRFELANRLAKALQAEYFHPETLRAEDLVRIAKNDQ